MDIPRRVKNLVKKYGTSCPFQIAAHLNINVRIKELPESVRGLYCRVLRRRFIVINNALPEQWQRFVCAHELGHDRLHRGLGYYFIEEHTLFHPGKFERQANMFAVQLLISGETPEEYESIESFYHRHDVPLEVIGKI
ncbi:ImmA/IrrE family metallo-endopeptidase [Alicyclobacillus acidoterrestris]|uniref:ImmA/IrrE family metallo-endopeptidase n=1 Tax=Alicyclobacillus acidoterrestris TaxID=1450 RepID=UPI003F52F222